MAILEQNEPTFVLRKICENIQIKIGELIKGLNLSQLKKPQILNSINSIIDYGYNNEKLLKSISISDEQQVLQILKNQMIRIVSTQLPNVITYQTKLQNKIQDLYEQLELVKKNVKQQKQKNQQLILQKDERKLQALELEYQNKALQDEIEIEKQKYDEAMELVNKYMKQVKKLQSEKIQTQKIREKLKLMQRQEQFATLQQTIEIKATNFSPKYLVSPKAFSTPQINFPLQIKQKLNEAQKLLNRSPRSNDPQLQSSHFHLSSQIVGCQKQLLQIQLRQSETQIISLRTILQQQRQHTNNLQFQIRNLQKLLKGQKQLSENLDRQLFMLTNAAKQMKIQLLEEKTHKQRLKKEILQIQQSYNSNNYQHTKMQQKINSLLIETNKIQILQQTISQLKTKLQISQRKYEEIRKTKNQLQQNFESLQGKISEYQKRQIQSQIKKQLYQQNMKQQNFSKIKQIEQMAMMIKQKYQKKIEILQNQLKEIKQKYKGVKQENSRLYECMETNTRKELKLEQKQKKAEQRLQMAENQNNELKKSNNLLIQKCKTQSLLNKQLKREIVESERQKTYLQKKINKFQVSILPNIKKQIQKLRQQQTKLPVLVSTNMENLSKLSKKLLLQFQNKLSSIINQKDQALSNLQNQIVNKQIMNFTTTQYYKKEIQKYNNQKQIITQNCKKQIQKASYSKDKEIQKINIVKQTQVQLLNQKIVNLQMQIIKNANDFSSLQQSNQHQHKQIIKISQQISLLSKQLLNTQDRNKLLQKQIEEYRKLEQFGFKQLEVLRQKQKQVEKFYKMTENLRQQNKELRNKLERVIYEKSIKEVSFNAGIKHNQISTSYLIPQKINNQNFSKSYQALTNTHHSHSCSHIHSQNHKKPSINFGTFKPLSVQKKLHKCKPSYLKSQNVSYDLGLQSRPKKVTNTQNNWICSNVQQSQNNIAKIGSRYEFESQKQRLEQIKQQYQRLITNKFRQELIENSKSCLNYQG